MRRFAAALPAVLCLVLFARADEPKTITVHGKGTAKAKPDLMVVTFNASGKAEKAADAAEKLKIKVKSLRDDLDAVLKEKGALAAKIEDTGIAFPGAAQGGGMAQMVIWNNANPPDAQAAEVSATSEVRVIVPGVDAMKIDDVAALVSALLDRGIAAGGEQGSGQACGINVFAGRMGGSSSPVRFAFSDIEAAQSKAWDEAVKKARARAEAIASKLGLAVGGAVKVRDLSEGDANDKAAAVATAMVGGKTSGASSGETELNVELEVEFELTKADKK